MSAVWKIQDATRERLAQVGPPARGVSPARARPVRRQRVQAAGPGRATRTGWNPARDPRAGQMKGPRQCPEEGTVSGGGRGLRWREWGGRRRSGGRARERGGGVTHNVGSAEDSGRDRLREPGGGRWSGLESGSEPFPKPLRDSRSREAQRCACGARAACVSVRIKGATRARGEEGRTEPE